MVYRNFYRLLHQIDDKYVVELIALNFQPRINKLKNHLAPTTMVGNCLDSISSVRQSRLNDFEMTSFHPIFTRMPFSLEWRTPSLNAITQICRTQKTNSEDFSHLRSMSTMPRKIDIDGGCDAMLYVVPCVLYPTWSLNIVLCTNIFVDRLYSDVFIWAVWRLITIHYHCFPSRSCAKERRIFHHLISWMKSAVMWI